MLKNLERGPSIELQDLKKKILSHSKYHQYKNGPNNYKFKLFKNGNIAF